MRCLTCVMGLSVWHLLWDLVWDWVCGIYYGIWCVASVMELRCDVLMCMPWCVTWIDSLHMSVWHDSTHSHTQLIPPSQSTFWYVSDMICLCVTWHDSLTYDSFTYAKRDSWVMGCMTCITWDVWHMYDMWCITWDVWHTHSCVWHDVWHTSTHYTWVYDMTRLTHTHN